MATVYQGSRITQPSKRCVKHKFAPHKSNVRTWTNTQWTQVITNAWRRMFRKHVEFWNYEVTKYVSLDPNLSRIRGTDQLEVFISENARWCSTPPTSASQRPACTRFHARSGDWRFCVLCDSDRLVAQWCHWERAVCLCRKIVPKRFDASVVGKRSKHDILQSRYQLRGILSPS